MKLPSCLGLVGLSLALSGSHAAAQSVAVSRPYIVATAGRSVELAKFAAINPDCSSIEPIAVNLVVAARGGDVQVGEGGRYMAFAPPNPRAACNRRKVRTTFVLYKASPGFAGQDSFVIETVYPGGTAQRVRMSVNVR